MPLEAGTQREPAACRSAQRPALPPDLSVPVCQVHVAPSGVAGRADGMRRLLPANTDAAPEPLIHATDANYRNPDTYVSARPAVHPQTGSAGASDPRRRYHPTLGARHVQRGEARMVSVAGRATGP